MSWMENDYFVTFKSDPKVAMVEFPLSMTQHTDLTEAACSPNWSKKEEIGIYYYEIW